MDITYNNFIGRFDNVFPEGYCQYMINEFDRLEKLDVGYSRLQAEGALPHRKNDIHLEYTLKYEMYPREPFQTIEGEKLSPVRLFYEGLQRCFNEYTTEFSVLQKGGNIKGAAMKMQRTPPGGGYHVWHCEQGPEENANRCLVYMLYLNTLEPSAGAETEFLYQRTRVPPTENTLIIWPASFTHTHRGNTVLGDKDKYVITGWFFYE